MSSPQSLTARTAAEIPKGPVFGWDNFRPASRTDIPSVMDLAHVAFTTSGRAAIYQALLQMALPPGSKILIPTYHCPTMVAPVLLAGHVPAYFELRADGLPDVERLAAQGARALLVSQYFGLAQSLHEVRAWCDANDVLLIEDCAHCYFGQAGSRPIGAWGDYCTASLSKFFPVPEAGLLGSAHRVLRPLELTPQGARAELKGWIDVLETAARFGKLPGLNGVLRMLFRLKGGLRNGRAAVHTTPILTSTDAMMTGCDMGRIEHRVLNASMALHDWASLSRVIALRARNFARYRQLLIGLPDQSALAALPLSPTAPYVYPVWVNDADRVYQALRGLGVPVFRWDRIWAGTPVSATDAGPRWSQHLLQLLCHQDLAEDDIRYSSQKLLALVGSRCVDASHASPTSEFLA